MDKKIIKYKLKKNKLEEKIIDILNLKNEYYENEIINSNNNEIITEGVENFFHNLKLNQKEHLVIIVFGSYSVGKTTFILHLENYIQMIVKNITNKTIVELVQKFIISPNDINFLINCDLSSKITIIECDLNIVNQINSLMIKTNIININIIPKNPITLKNKIINKIISDIKNKSSNFIEFIKDAQIIDEDNYIIVSNGINLLKIKNGILTMNDLIFIDKTINLYYLYIINLYSSINIDLPLNTHKYYL